MIVWWRASRFGSFLWNVLRFFFSFKVSRPVDEVIPDSHERQRPLWLQTQMNMRISSRSWHGDGLWPCSPLWSEGSSDRPLSSEWPWTLSQTFLPAPHMGKLGAQKAKARVWLPQHGTVPSQVLMFWNVSQNQVKLPLPLLIFPIEKLNPFYFICSQETNQTVSLFDLLTSGSLEASLIGASLEQNAPVTDEEEPRRPLHLLWAQSV